MEFLKLHDIPIKTLTKYFLTNDKIHHNSRYEPYFEDKTVNIYYQYVYKMNDKRYSVDTVEVPNIFMPDDVFSNLFNVDFDNLDTFEITVPNYSNTALQTAAKSDLDFYKDLRNNTVTTRNLFSSVFNAFKKTGIKTTSNKPIYYLPFKNIVSSYMNYQSLYPYFGIIDNRPFYALTSGNYLYKYKPNQDSEYINNTVLLFKNNIHINLLGIKEYDKIWPMDQEHLLKYDKSVANSVIYFYETVSVKDYYTYDQPSNTHKKINNDTFNSSIKYYEYDEDSNQYFITEDKRANQYTYKYHIDIDTGLKYIKIYKYTNPGNSHSLIECGKIYKLNKFKKIEHNKNGYKYRDTYTDTDVYLDTPYGAITPIMRYHNYMRKIKKFAYKGESTEFKDDGGERFNERNRMYLSKFGTYWDIASANYYTTLEGQTETGLQITDINMVNYITARKLKVPTITSESFVGADDSVTSYELPSSKQKELKSDRLEIYKTNIEFENEDPEHRKASDSYYSTIKTYFNTKDVYVLRPKLYNGKMSFKDYGISLITASDFINLPKYKSSAYKYVKILNKKSYIALKNMAHYTKFIAFCIAEKDNLMTDIPSDIDYDVMSDFNCLKQKHTLVYEFEITTEPPDTATLYNSTGDDYILKLKPLNVYLSEQKIIKYVYNTVDGGDPKAFTCNRKYNTLKKPSLSGIKLSTLANINDAFKAGNSISEVAGTQNNNVDSGNLTMAIKDNMIIDTMNSTLVPNPLSETLAINDTASKHFMYKYTDNLFKNLIYTLNVSAKYNEGGICVDKYTKSHFYGFIPYDRVEASYITGSKYSIIDPADANYYSTTQLSLSDADIELIKNQVLQQNVLDRLINYEKYPLNAQLIRDKIRSQTMEKRYIASHDDPQPVNITKADDVTYKERYFDCHDILEKTYSLITEYLSVIADSQHEERETVLQDSSLGNEKSVVINTNDSSVDKVLETSALNENFYKQNIPLFINTLSQDTNRLLYINNHNYNIKHVFNNDSDDKNTFLLLLRSQLGEGD